MVTNENNTTCGFADEIVSYIYDETAPTDRAKFEDHLVGCTSCTDEFAGISHARFSMFEWRKEEFAHLLTPEIVIPYEPKKADRSAESHEGFFSGLRGLIGLSGWPAAAAAALAVCIGLGFIGISYFGRGETPLAANRLEPPTVQPVVLPSVNDESGPRDNIAAVAPGNELAGHGSNVVKAVEIHHPRSNRQAAPFAQRLANNMTSPRSAAPQVKKAPVLSSYDDSDDKSLRLADLFDEVGQKR